MPKASQKQIIKPPPQKVVVRKHKIESVLNPKQPQDEMPPSLRKLYDSLADRAPASDRYVPKNTFYTGPADPYPYSTKPNIINPPTSAPKGKTKPIPKFTIIRKKSEI